MPKRPTSIEIRSYQVGFGDCFLLSFIYGKADRRDIVIDFGTTELPSKHGVTIKPSIHMPRIAADIETVCGGDLTAVVATHRHADHISGFATDGASGGSGKIIAACNPKLVLQPWTEDPDAATDATSATTDAGGRSPKSFVASLSAMNGLAEHITALVASGAIKMSAAAAKRLQFLGMDNIANKSAVQNLIAMGKRKNSRAVYAHHGSNPGFARLLPGVEVTVLGPPDLRQSESIRKMRSSDPDEFWQLLGGSATFRSLDQAQATTAAKRRASRAIPAEAHWFVDRLTSLTASQLLGIVRSLDQEMNNTSLILLFEVGGKKLLFPGDAQLENWSWALRDAPNAHATRQLLADVDVYKVGHHGSRNATPRQLLWEKFRKRGGSKESRLVSFLSTLPGKHGSASSKTEVPRKTLLSALETQTVLHDTESLTWGKTPELCDPVVIPL